MATKPQSDLFDRTAMVHSSADYVVYKPTGEHVIDRHTASGFNPLFNRRHLEWDDRFAESILYSARLPRLLNANRIAGTIGASAAAETGLNVGTPVTAGMIDIAAESVSVGVIDPGDMMLMYGSTMFLLNLVDELKPDRRLWTGAYSLPDSQVMTGGMATSGLITWWFREELAGDERRRELETGTSAYQLLCAQAEDVSPAAMGRFASRTSPGIEHPARPGRPRDVAGLKLLHIMSDIAGISQLVPERTLGASRGDAFLTGLASGIIESIDALSAGWTRPARTVDPRPVLSARYDEYYDVYRALYENTKEKAHALIELSRDG